PNLSLGLGQFNINRRLVDGTLRRDGNKVRLQARALNDLRDVYDFVDDSRPISAPSGKAGGDERSSSSAYWPVSGARMDDRVRSGDSSIYKVSGRWKQKLNAETQINPDGTLQPWNWSWQNDE